MKTIYLFSGGGFVIAHDASEFVTKMRNSSLFGYCEHDEKFMKQVADRSELYNGANIRTDNANDFLNDLIDNEFVIAINPQLPLRIS